ncbi:Tetratricopeptide repeat-containing protein [Pustulibacterium marinum]|uniref:Tetratricopeptide repeat-containing protein n=1 Tax=Pustulibacterium marinum TaxID=1224947 RepID=A0A1I7ITA7_9FLAO|nr:tetratricopeptide repeat protein [Pustulibacterium marinum]SFU76184.1 Tetratricopeptide repeat-containing protein [Pustulibacterium marinum]
MHKGKYLSIFSFLLFLLSCSDALKEVPVTFDKDEIETFDSLVSLDIHSAQIKAKEALATSTGVDSLRLKALYFNARISIQLGDFENFMKYGDATLQLSDSLQSPFFKNKIHELLGRYYTQHNEYPKALEYYLLAENYFETLKDNHNLSSIYNGLGILYFDLKEYEKSKQYFNKAYHLYVQIGDKRGEGIFYANMGNVYNINAMYDEALTYQQKSYYVFKSIHDTTNMISSMINLSNIKAQTGKIDEAIEQLDTAFELSEANKSTLRLKERILLNYALLYLSLKKYDKAKKILREHDIVTDSLEYISGKLDAIDVRIDIANAEKDFEDVAAYTIAFYQLKDSVYGAQTKQKIEELKWQNEFDKSRLESELLQSKYQIEKERGTYLSYTIVLVILLSLVIISLVWVLYKNIRNNLKISKISNEKLQEQVKTEQLTIENERAENEILKLKAVQQTTELDAKNREITSINLQLLAKNKIMTDISKVVDRKNKSVSAIEKDLKSIVFQNQNQEKEWEQFKEVFEKIHPGFFDTIKLKYPQLSATDLRICAYIKIRMSLNETANLLNITLQSLHTSRYRIRKKLNLPSEISLDDFIHEIEVVQ